MESQSRARINSGLSEFSALPSVPIADKGLGRGRVVADGLKQLGVENNRRWVSQIEAMMADFDKTANELESWIQAEHRRTRIHDPSNPVYSTSARAMAQRRDKLNRSIDVLKRQLADIASAASS
jgi:dynactin complex subunit